MQRSVRWLAALGIAAAAVAAAGLAHQQSDSPASRRLSAPDAEGGYIVVIPPGAYQALVVSPRDGGGSVQFILRTRSAAGASDFPFFVPAGDIRSIQFPHGLSITTPSALIAPRSVSFAAWGVSAGTRQAESVSPGGLVRFEPLGRDPDRDDRDRRRGREFDEFLREVERTR